MLVQLGRRARGWVPASGRSLTLAVLGRAHGTASVSERPEARRGHLAGYPPDTVNPDAKASE